MPKPRRVEMEVPSFLGLNTALSFSEIDIKQSPRMLNLLPRKIGSIGNRPGTKPITVTALGAPIEVLCNLRKNGANSILATSGTTLYKYNSGTNVFDAQTMTDALNSANIDYAQFKDQAGAEVLVIADGGSLKAYDGTAVADITPAADDTPPLPANDLADINANHEPIGCLVHNTRVVIWDGSDTIWHSKVGYHDYFPETNFQRFVRENDYVVTCVSFSGALIVFLRRHVGVLFGDGYIDPPTSGDWSQDFLDTSDGCMNGKTVQTVTFPDGRQEIFYLSDNGVNSVYTIDTLSLDTSARYSTRSVTKDKINWTDLDVTKSEWESATAHFYEGQYWLIYPQDDEWKGLVYDTSSGEWYPIDNIEANSFYHDETQFYYAGDAGHLRVFDADLFSDWNESTLTTGTPINKYWYSKLMTPKLTGFDHFWDVLMIEARQFFDVSSIDIEVNTYRDQYSEAQAVATTIMVVGVTPIGVGQIHNENLTDAVNNAKRKEIFVGGQYAQLKFSNDRDEPVEIFSFIFEVRMMTKY